MKFTGTHLSKKGDTLYQFTVGADELKILFQMAENMQKNLPRRDITVQQLRARTNSIWREIGYTLGIFKRKATNRKLL